MGTIPSVSLPSLITCRKDCGCREICYAKKMERRWRNVHESYMKNYQTLIKDPAQYWAKVEAIIMTSRFFRFHVAGDTPNTEYFDNVVSMARKYEYCRMLIFTKKYELVNGWMEDHAYSLEDLPDNLQVVFSVWRDLECPNPYHFPEAHVRYKDGYTTANENAYECGGNCTECAITDSGCWTLPVGGQVVFKQH